MLFQTTGTCAAAWFSESGALPVRYSQQGIYFGEEFIMSKVTVIVVLLLLSFLGGALRARPLDQRAVSAAVATRQLNALAVTLLKYHPYLRNPRVKSRFDAKLAALRDSIHRPLPMWREWLLQQQLIRTLDDPHTMLYPLFLEDRALAVDLHWVSDGVLISPGSWMHPPLFPKNSLLLRLGPDDPKVLLSKLKALYAGTPEFIAAGPGFELYCAYELRWLGLVDIKNRVAVLIKTPAGDIRHLRIPLTHAPSLQVIFKTERHKSWYRWTVDKKHNIGWFTLNQMKLSGSYEQAVVAFFDAVERAGVTRIAVDLRHNGGGESLAEAPFMQYLGVKKITDYNPPPTYFDPKHLTREIRQLEAGLKKLSPPGTAVPSIPVPPAPPANRIFHGRFYVVTGPGCFSSAMEFAADVKFNHLGTIVGRPCAEVVTGPGEVKEEFAHPPSGVPFQVSTNIFTWPGLPRNALVEPDVAIPLTVREVQQHVDPVRRWFDETNSRRRHDGPR